MKPKVSKRVWGVDIRYFIIGLIIGGLLFFAFIEIYKWLHLIWPWKW